MSSWDLSTNQNTNGVGAVYVSYISQATGCITHLEIQGLVNFVTNSFGCFIAWSNKSCNACFHFHSEGSVTFPKLLYPKDICLSQTAIYWTGQPHLFHSSPSWEAVILSQYPWHDLAPPHSFSLSPTKNQAKATCIQNSWLKHPAA